MPVAGWFTAIECGIAIAVIALALLQVIIHLVAVTKMLATLQGGVDAIAVSTAPVGPVVDSVNDSLAPVRAWCETV
ncbi:MAG TPA: hypothetical protein VHV82_09845 [Sporichthyaceae bacterium]|jgi:hypothetical protein|nr:hypothetical protein [Sporichthyaceae bacterium]